MAKKRTMNELRQEKPYGYKAPEKDLLYTRPAVPKGGGDYERGDIASDEGKKYLNIAGDIDLIEAAKDQIIKQLQDDFYDVIFQAVADKMNENYMFRENNYLTEAGMDEFEDAWFEWYHNHHGDILSAVLKNLGH